MNEKDRDDKDSGKPEKQEERPDNDAKNEQAKKTCRRGEVVPGGPASRSFPGSG